ncbi:Tol-Pal system protein TolR [Sinobacterium norvegicum]|uniref:Tol-Pal system protein TolR n=1 Tax=Sinobacterium norvegicum TaxID=1641715 RepID=A0ABM9ABL9_9GAMM|nr:biopolymer transporter ExbD [Sinobacterium norvegicum]CAH0990606.1 Tol-Pal system protein TolR [Sinobacterium norvegicum]
MINSRSEQDSGVFGAPELTPLIDIVFIVIVFLLLTANSPLLKLPIDIPESSEETTLAASDAPVITVAIAAEKPYWRIEEQPFTDWVIFKESLLEQMATADQTITIAADKAAPTEPLLQLLAFLHQNNITNTQIIMEQPSSSL